MRGAGASPSSPSPSTESIAHLEQAATPPDWLTTCRLMLLLHKTEKEIYDGMSPAMIQRLSFVLEVDAEMEEKRHAEAEAENRVRQKMARGGAVPSGNYR